MVANNEICAGAAETLMFESEILCFCCELNHSGAHLEWNYTECHLHVTMASYRPSWLSIDITSDLNTHTILASGLSQERSEKSMVIMDT